MPPLQLRQRIADLLPAFALMLLLKSAVHGEHEQETYRERAIRQLCHHIFRIGEAHLECAVRGARNLEELTRVPLADGTFTTGAEIARYGDEVISRIEQWWNGLADKSFRDHIEILNYGVITTHQLLERSTWHSAHHTRQIADVLKRQGIKPDGMLDVAGLPMPERIWD